MFTENIAQHTVNAFSNILQQVVRLPYHCSFHMLTLSAQMSVHHSHSSTSSSILNFSCMMYKLHDNVLLHIFQLDMDCPGPLISMSRACEFVMLHSRLNVNRLIASHSSPCIVGAADRNWSKRSAEFLKRLQGTIIAITCNVVRETDSVPIHLCSGLRPYTKHIAWSSSRCIHMLSVSVRLFEMNFTV